MLAMALTGTAAWMNENYVLLVSCALVFLAAMTLEVVWLVLLYRRRRHRSARPYEES
jgi:Flp pilus assembly protein TadB